VPLTVFQIQGVPGHRRDRIEAAVTNGGKHVAGSYEAWIVADGFRPEFKVIITGPQGFQRMVICDMDEQPVLITERVRDTLEEL
jgi:hypothetical protein